MEFRIEYILMLSWSYFIIVANFGGDTKLTLGVSYSFRSLKSTYMQVRALQRLGSRFENLSGHERSCILSGQHRTGHCTCRINNRDTNINDNTSARASISRIVMLAEALFEVK